MAKKVLMVIAPKNFRDEELFHTKEELEKAGLETKVASKTSEEATGMMGKTIKPDIALDDVVAEDFDAIVFVGGSGASVYFDDTLAMDLARTFFQQGKVVAAICIAPSILANAGVLKDKVATAWSSEQGNLEEKGATYSGEAVTVDGKIITASGPKAAREFGKKIAEALK